MIEPGTHRVILRTLIIVVISSLLCKWQSLAHQVLPDKCRTIKVLFSCWMLLQLMLRKETEQGHGNFKKKS